MKESQRLEIIALLARMACQRWDTLDANEQSYLAEREQLYAVLAAVLLLAGKNAGGCDA